MQDLLKDIIKQFSLSLDKWGFQFWSLFNIHQFQLLPTLKPSSRGLNNDVKFVSWDPKCLWLFSLSYVGNAKRKKSWLADPTSAGLGLLSAMEYGNIPDRRLEVTDDARPAEELLGAKQFGTAKAKICGETSSLAYQVCSMRCRHKRALYFLRLSIIRTLFYYLFVNWI